MRVLFATSEVHPLIKTGGLADVSASLPAALAALNHDVRLVLPAYRSVLQRLDDVRHISQIGVPGFGATARILAARTPDGVPLYLVAADELFDRPGGPYTDPEGRDWPDNPVRFCLYAHAVRDLALGQADPEWAPEVVHCNDWQTGLVPALLDLEAQRPATVFTVHNLAYQGLFPWATFQSLGLPTELWSFDRLEFHGRLSFIKGGLSCADWLTTVSPTYAEEITTPEFGYGLEGLFDHRRDRLTGILNGIDERTWNPATDALIAHPYDAERFDDKALNKADLQQRMGLPVRADVPLIGHVGRLVEQKGVDLLVDALPALLEAPLQVAILGSGNRELEHALTRLAEAQPERVAVRIGYDETLAHRIEAGADVFAMPSRFEPCGLNQMYSLRYGTVPVVRSTGGLADSVVDAQPEALADGRATGFVFDAPTAGALLEALQRTLTLYPDGKRWRRLATTGMAQRFGWKESAERYLEVYRSALWARA